MTLSKPTILSVEMHEVKYTIEMPTSEMTLNEYYQLCKALAFSIGYSPELVSEVFDIVE